MADEMPRADEVTNLTPEEVVAGLREGRILLVDVREPNETARERYPGAVIIPMSVFDAELIPDPQGRLCPVCRTRFPNTPARGLAVHQCRSHREASVPAGP